MTASSIVTPGVAVSHRSSHRAARRRDRGRSFNAVSAVSSSASARSSGRPISSAVTSATTRSPRSIAFLKIALDVPWFPVGRLSEAGWRMAARGWLCQGAS